MVIKLRNIKGANSLKVRQVNVQQLHVKDTSATGIADAAASTGARAGSSARHTIIIIGLLTDVETNKTA